VAGFVLEAPTLQANIFYMGIGLTIVVILGVIGAVELFSPSSYTNTIDGKERRRRELIERQEEVDKNRYGDYSEKPSTE